MRHVKVVPKRIRSNNTEFKKSIQLDFNKNEKQKNVVEYLQEEAESVWSMINRSMMNMSLNKRNVKRLYKLLDRRTFIQKLQ